MINLIKMNHQINWSWSLKVDWALVLPYLEDTQRSEIPEHRILAPDPQGYTCGRDPGNTTADVCATWLIYSKYTNWPFIDIFWGKYGSSSKANLKGIVNILGTRKQRPTSFNTVSRIKVVYSAKRSFHLILTHWTFKIHADPPGGPSADWPLCSTAQPLLFLKNHEASSLTMKLVL